MNPLSQWRVYLQDAQAGIKYVHQSKQKGNILYNQIYKSCWLQHFNLSFCIFQCITYPQISAGMKRVWVTLRCHLCQLQFMAIMYEKYILTLASVYFNV